MLMKAFYNWFRFEYISLLTRSKRLRKSSKLSLYPLSFSWSLILERSINHLSLQMATAWFSLALIANFLIQMFCKALPYLTFHLRKALSCVSILMLPSLLMIGISKHFSRRDWSMSLFWPIDILFRFFYLWRGSNMNCFFREAKTWCAVFLTLSWKILSSLKMKLEAWMKLLILMLEMALISLLL